MESSLYQKLEQVYLELAKVDCANQESEQALEVATDLLVEILLPEIEKECGK